MSGDGTADARYAGVLQADPNALYDEGTKTPKWGEGLVSARSRALDDDLYHFDPHTTGARNKPEQANGRGRDCWERVSDSTPTYLPEFEQQSHQPVLAGLGR